MAAKLDTTGDVNRWRIGVDPDASAKQAYRDYLALVERILEEAIATRRHVAISSPVLSVDHTGKPSLYSFESLYVFLNPNSDPQGQVKRLPPTAYWTLYLTAGEEAQSLLEQVRADYRRS